LNYSRTAKAQRRKERQEEHSVTIFKIGGFASQCRCVKRKLGWSQWAIGRNIFL